MDLQCRAADISQINAGLPLPPRFSFCPVLSDNVSTRWHFEALRVETCRCELSDPVAICRGKDGRPANVESEATRGSDVDISQTRGTGSATGSSALFMRDGSTNLPLKHSGPIRHGAKCQRRDNARPFTFMHNYRIGRLTVLISFFSTCKRSHRAFEASLSSVFPKSLRVFLCLGGFGNEFLTLIVSL